MRRSGWILITMAVAGGFAVRSGCSQTERAPDEQLASHFASICRIADQHVDSPQTGVRKLMRYMGDHAPEMLQQWGELLVITERLDDDAAHDDRARLAGRRFARVLEPCAEPMAEFGEAVEEDPEANRLLQTGMNRLNRSLEIIFSGGAMKLQTLPALLGLRLDAALRR